MKISKRKMDILNLNWDLHDDLSRDHGRMYNLPLS